MTLENRKSSKVRQSGHTLVAAFHNANPPLIWKFDLERNHSFSLALQGDDGDWELGVLSPKEEFHPVARFLSREDAEEAFAKTQKALLATKNNSWRTMALTLLGILVLLFAAILWLWSSTHSAGTRTMANGSPGFTAPPPALPVIRDGVPLSADDVLKQPAAQ